MYINILLHYIKDIEKEAFLRVAEELAVMQATYIYIYIYIVMIIIIVMMIIIIMIIMIIIIICIYI